MSNDIHREEVIESRLSVALAIYDLASREERSEKVWIGSEDQSQPGSITLRRSR
jgi:hypothetical protein